MFSVESQGREVKKESIPQCLAINSLGVIAFSRTLKGDCQRMHLCLGRKNKFHGTLTLTLNIHREQLRSCSDVYVYLWFPDFILCSFILF